jgi:hypothetical protein
MRCPMLKEGTRMSGIKSEGLAARRGHEVAE